MIGFLRLAIFAAIGLGAAYFLMSIYMRSLHREALEKEWDARAGEGLPPRETFIEEGMATYEGSLRAKLIWLVVIVPLVLFGLVLYLMNFTK